MSDPQTWIGESTPNDNLDLEKITTALPAEAAALRTILRDGKITGLLRIRREASSIAARAQKTFKRLSAAAVLGAAIATLSSGLLLYGAGSDAAGQARIAAPATVAAPAPQPQSAAPAQIEQELVRWVTKHRAGIIVIQIAGLFISTVAAGVLGSLRLVDRWAENRNKAELLRREVFNEVLKLAQEMVPAVLEAPDPRNPVSSSPRVLPPLSARVADRLLRKGWRARRATRRSADLAHGDSRRCCGDQWGHWSAGRYSLDHFCFSGDRGTDSALRSAVMARHEPRQRQSGWLCKSKGSFAGDLA